MICPFPFEFLTAGGFVLARDGSAEGHNCSEKTFAEEKATNWELDACYCLGRRDGSEGRAESVRPVCGLLICDVKKNEWFAFIYTVSTFTKVRRKGPNSYGFCVVNNCIVGQLCHSSDLTASVHYSEL